MAIFDVNKFKMTMLRKLFFLGAIFLSSIVSAQIKTSEGVDFSISNPYKVVDAGSKRYFQKDGEVLSIKFAGKKVIFQKYTGDKLNEVERNEAILEKGVLLEELHQIDDKIYLFYSIYDRSSISEQLFYREVSFDKVGFVSEPKLIVKTDGKVSGTLTSIFSVFAMKVTNKFDIYRSIDDKRIVVQYRMKPKEKRDALNNDKIGLHVFNNSIEEEWGGVYEMPYTEKRMDNISYTVDSKGSAHILAFVRNSETASRDDQHLEILTLKADSEVEAKEIEIEGNYFSQLDFFDGGNDNLLVCGFYSKSRGAGVDGLFAANVDSDGNLSSETYEEIPVEIISKYMTEKQQERLKKKDDKNDLKMTNMYIRDVNIDKNGNTTIIAEKYYVVTRRNSNGTTTTTYYYEDILVARMSAEGELLWMDKFAKRQLSGRPRGGIGFYQKHIGDYTYLLFMDNVNNLEIGDSEIPKYHKDGLGGFLTGYKIDNETGKAEKISILDTRNAIGVKLYQFKTERIVDIDENSFAVEFYKKGKEDVMIKVTID